MSVGDSGKSAPKLLVIFAFVLTGAFNGDHERLTARAQEPTNPQSTMAVDLPDTDNFEQLRKSLSQLTREVERLARRVAALERERLFDVTRVLLVGEEQRAESLHARTRENFERTAFYQARLDQVEIQLRPENIERLFIGVGMVRPEEARDNVRRRLSIEKQMLGTQLEFLRQERNRFQSALATADVAIQRFRLRLAEAARP